MANDLLSWKMKFSDESDDDDITNDNITRLISEINQINHILNRNRSLLFLHYLLYIL